MQHFKGVRLALGTLFVFQLERYDYWYFPTSQLHNRPTYPHFSLFTGRIKKLSHAVVDEVPRGEL